jgi:hypothetical protein
VTAAAINSEVAKENGGENRHLSIEMAETWREKAAAAKCEGGVCGVTESKRRRHGGINH